MEGKNSKTNINHKIMLIMNRQPKTPELIKAHYLKEYSLSYIKASLKKMAKNDLILEASECISNGYAYSLGFYIL